MEQLWQITFLDGTVVYEHVIVDGKKYEFSDSLIRANNDYDAIVEYKKEEPHVTEIKVYSLKVRYVLGYLTRKFEAR